MIDRFFYPHTIQIKIANVFTDLFECGEQTNGAGRMIDANERTNYVFKSLIFIPNKYTRYFKPGQEVRIIDHAGNIVIDGKVAKFDLGRLEDNRMWI